MRTKAKAPTAALRPYQATGVAHLLRNPCGGLFMDPGTGKTLTLYTAFYVLKKRKLIDKLLVFAPLSAVYEVWRQEAEKWGFPFKMAILHGSKKEQALNEDADVYLINYDGIGWLAQEKNFKRLMKHGKRWWAAADESTKVKHTSTARFKALRPMLTWFERRTPLTGTPVPNGLEDLFGQVYFADLGARLGQYITQYRRAYFYPSGYGGHTWALQADGEKRIYEKLADLFYRVPDSVLGLKKIHTVDRWVTLPPKVMRKYQAFEREFILELRGGSFSLAANGAVLSSKLRQVANGFVYDADKKAYYMHGEKLEVLGDLVEQLQGNPLLVAFEFTAVGQAIGDRFKCPVINGKTPRAEYGRLLAEFKAGRLPLLAAQASMISLSLNLQDNCHHVAWYGLVWNLEDYIQFVKRVHRSGQKKTVFLHHILAKDTIEEVVNEVVRGSKTRTQTKLLAAVMKAYAK